MSSPATPAKLSQEATVGPTAAAPAASDRDADATAAVEAVLKEQGADRKLLEGPAASVVIPPEGPAKEPAKEPVKEPVKPADDKGKPGAKETPAKEGAPATPGKEATPAAPTDADLDLNLTAEDLAEIEKNPLAKKAYKTMVRGLNKRLAEVAEQRKGNEVDLDIMSKVRANPIAGLQALAAVAGISISIGGAAPTPGDGKPTVEPPKPKTPLEIAEERLAGVFTPDGVKALAPILVEVARAVAASEIEPVKADLATAQTRLAESGQVQAQTQLDSALLAYGRAVEARGDDWTPEVQKAMSALIGKVLPGKDTTLNEYLDTLYYRVTGERSSQAVRARQLERLRAAVNASETPVPVRSTPTRATDQQITTGMDDDEATSLAVAQTLEELRGR